MRKIPIIASLLILLSVILARNSFAEIYKYVDKNGTECLTDDLRSVPEKYKKKAIIISGQSKKGGQETSEIQPSENKENDPTFEKKEETAKIKDAIKGLVRSKLFKLIAGIIGFLFIFIIVGKASNSLGHGKVGSILRIVLTLLVLLYVFNAHLKEIVNAFATLKEEVLGVKKQAEERNKKVDEIINELPEKPQK